MINAERLLRVLKDVDGYCDDCLSEITEIKPRQQINQLARRLKKDGKVFRRQNRCRKCNKTKIINSLNLIVPEANPIRVDSVKGYNEKIGDVMEKTKSLEYYLNCIISNFISPKETGFFDNVILNNGIVSIGDKLKVIKTICNARKVYFNFDRLHQLINIRNLFAHESSYVEFDNGSMLVKIDELKSNGKYIETTFNSKYDEFQKLDEELKWKLINLVKQLNENK